MKVQHRIEPMLEGLPGDEQLYVSWREQHTVLRSFLHSANGLPCNISPMNAIPYLSRVDAGTIELIRGLGVEGGDFC